MIDCLSNYIGIQGIEGYQNPDSGYFINDLQGITTNQIEDISDDEDHYETRLAWVDIYNRASRLLESDIRHELRKFLKNNTSFKTGITGQITKDNTLTQSDIYNGWRFDFGYEYKSIVISLESFDLYLNTAVDFDVYVFDLNTGEQLWTEAFSGTAGLKTYMILQKFAAHRHSDLFVCYDANQVSTKEMTDYNPTGLGRRVTVSKSSVLSANANTSTTGMSVTFNLECSVSNFVCQRLDYFRDAFLYKLGVETCSERIYSDRINRYTLMDREEAEKLRLEFEVEYKRLIEQALKDMNPDSDGHCFECNKAHNYKTMLP